MSTVPSRLRSTEIDQSEAFDAAVARESHRLWILALSILRDQGEAEDAVQETLVKGWMSRRSLGDFASAGPWLTRVCVNHCLSRGRRLRMGGRIHREGPDHSAFAPYAEIGGDLIDLERAFRRLSVKQRAAVTLNYRHGYSIDECADIMGCRPGTVRSHLARGLATLRKEMSDG